MADKELRTVPKISVRIWRPIIKKLDAKLEAACIRRDAYLRKVLEIEVGCLENEVSIPNSQAAYDYIAATLDKFDRKLVSLALPTELTSRINEVCARKRIVRDAFFNRLFLLLAAAPKLIDQLMFNGIDLENWRTEVWIEYKHDGPFFQNVFYPLESTIDPLLPIRWGIDIANKDVQFEDYVEPTNGKTIEVARELTGEPSPKDSLYTTIFDQKAGDSNLAGMNCYMADWQIPGHGAAVEHEKKLDEMLGF